MSLYRSLDPKYKQYIISEYDHWTLLINDDQAYLGRAYAWLVRQGEMQRLTSLTSLEREELFEVVLREYEAALDELWQPDHMNYAWLGNYFRQHGGHGHMHLIPRYSGDRKLGTLIFRDIRWEMNYTPHARKTPSVRTLLKIRNMLCEKIPGSVKE